MNTDKDLLTLRREYSRSGFSESDAAADPFVQFQSWLGEAVLQQLIEPYAMTLATAGPANKPSARVVLLRGVDDRGFTFFTNRQSRKGKELETGAWASLLFFWVELERQIRIEGTVEPTSDAESDAYFAGRPRGSQLAAAASEQSEVIPDRPYLEKRVEALARQFQGMDVPRPPHWGGYRIVPQEFEFWQGRPNRLHDRIRYRKAKEGGWIRERLAP